MTLAAFQRQGLISGPVAILLDVHARTLLDVCGACERSLSTEIILSHKALLRWSIAVNVLLGPAGTSFPTDLGY